MVWGIFKKDAVSETYKKMKSSVTEEHVTKEEVEQIDELSIGALKNYIKGAKQSKKFEADTQNTAMRKDDHMMASDAAAKVAKRKEGIKTAKAKLNKEEVEQLDEYESKDGVYKHQAKPGRYGGSEAESDYVKGPSDKDLKKIEGEKKKKSVKEESELEEGRRANTDSARAELSNRPRKPDSEEEAERKKKESDEAWERLMNHAASQKKESAGLEIFNEKELDVLINEVLSKDASAGTWISDFVKSDAPQFAGKSKEKRKQMALGAYYAAQRNESTDYESFVELDEEKQGDVVKMGAKEIKHANMKDKQDDQEIMEPHSGTEQKFIDAHSVRVTDDPTRDKLDTGKVSRASEPSGKGPGSYDAKEKLGKQGIKEAIIKTGAGEEIDTNPGEKKDEAKKGSSVKGQKVAGDDNDHS